MCLIVHMPACICCLYTAISAMFVEFQYSVHIFHTVIVHATLQLFVYVIYCLNNYYNQHKLYKKIAFIYYICHKHPIQKK